MDKPVPFWLIGITVLILVGGSYLIYLWLRNIKIDIKDSNDNIKRSS
ncbi:MAG: glutamyl-tRNA amidotransferase [Nautiliaceae bacterium]|jgi:hypothetical protein